MYQSVKLIYSKRILITLTLFAILFTCGLSAQILLSEDFNEGVLPVGWTIEEEVNSQNSWEFGNRIGITGNFIGYFASTMGRARSSLVTSSIDCSEYETLILSFDQQFRGFTFYGYVEISSDDSNWLTLMQVGENYGYPNPSVSTQIDISEYAAGQSSVTIRWRSEIDNFWWAIDNVQIISPDNGRPLPVKFAKPLESSEKAPTDIVLKWILPSLDDNRLGYRVYLDTDNPPVNYIEVGNVDHYNAFLEYNTTYYWQVVPYDEEGIISRDLCPVWSFTTRPEFAGGAGTEEDPWLIETAEHLSLVGSYAGEEYSGRNFKQVADIDLYEATREGGQFWNGGRGWSSIGDAFDFFYANYDGNAHIISGYYINSIDSQGLFGYISGASISNLGVVDIEVNGGDNTGGLIGRSISQSRVENCFSRGNVRGKNSVGGLIGFNDRSALVKTFSTVRVRGESNLGGLVGSRHIGQGFSDSFNYWNVQTSGQSSSTMGIGRNTADMIYPYSSNTYKEWDFYELWIADTNLQINNGYPTLYIRENQARPEASSTNYPLNAANNVSTALTLSWKINYNETFSNSPAGFRISLGTDNPPTNIIHNRNLGWLVSYTLEDVLEFERTYYWQITSYNEFGDSIDNETWSFTTSFFAGGLGTQNNPWQVDDHKRLNNVRLYIGEEHSNKHFIQTADIDLNVAPWNSGDGWIPIGDFETGFWGNYNGNGYSIDNLYIIRPSLDYVGLFGFSREATFRDVNLNNYRITGKQNVGSLSGELRGHHDHQATVINCSASGRISAERRFGGLLGYIFNTNIDNCHTVVEIIGQSEELIYAGGLIGFASTNAIITNSSSKGSISILHNGEVIGGLVGEANRASIINSFASFEISGGKFVGGLVGYHRSSLIDKSFSLGDISANNFVGGLVGTSNGAITRNSYSAANVSGNNTVGGLVGNNSSSRSRIENCYSRGQVSGNILVGGLVGFSYSNRVINSYSTSLVTGEEYTGGLVGISRFDDVLSSYWNIETSGQLTSDSGYGRTTEEMTYPYSEDTFEGWHFSSIWIADEDHLANDGYPRLRSLIPHLNPINVSFTAGDSFVQLNWSIPADLSPGHYNVYRNNQKINTHPITMREFIDRNVTNFTGYDYYVTTVFTGYGESLPSSVMNVTPVAAPRNLSAVVVDETNVLLQWEAPIIDNELILSQCRESSPSKSNTNFFANRSFAERSYELTGFNIYRDFELIAQTESTELSYLDQNLDYGLYYYQVTALYSDLESIYHDTIEVQIFDLETDNDFQPPLVTDLIGNYPNPFNPATTISFSLAEAGEVRLDIYNLRGQRVKTLVSEHLQPGFHQVVWDGKNENGKEISSGVYFYALRTNDTTEIKKMMVIK